jgi:hypothetical protein
MDTIHEHGDNGYHTHYDLPAFPDFQMAHYDDHQNGLREFVSLFPLLLNGEHFPQGYQPLAEQMNRINEAGAKADAEEAVNCRKFGKQEVSGW